MKKIYTFLGAAIIVLINACTYSDSDIFFVEPIPGDPPLITVGTNLDTIYDPRVTDSLEVIYNVVIENGEFYQAEAYLNEDLLYNSDTIRGSFWIIGDTLRESVDDSLFIYFFYSTNSNSLADIVHLEWNMEKLGYAISFDTGGLP